MNRNELRKMKIAVLYGGVSSEREISLRTGSAVLAALTRCGYNVVGIDADRDLAGKLVAAGAEVVFIALHGRHGEDGTVQGLLEILGLPYTGSGVLASSVAMDKVTTKQLLLQQGIRTPDFYVYRQGDDIELFTAQIKHWPVIAKPVHEGSTIGVTIADNPDELIKGLMVGLVYDHTILVEEFIQGEEATVSVLNGAALPVIQVVPKSGFYDFSSKYTAGQTEYLLPAPFSCELYTELQKSAVAAVAILGCLGAARADFMIKKGKTYCLEVNTIPGMTETSLLPKAAAYAGINFDELVQLILESAGTGK
jgi:D-alanine-D-alanine ligase